MTPTTMVNMVKYIHFLQGTEAQEPNRSGPVSAQPKTMGGPLVDQYNYPMDCDSPKYITGWCWPTPLKKY